MAMAASSFEQVSLTPIIVAVRRNDIPKTIF